MVEVIEPAARDKRLEALLAKYHGSRANRVLIFALYKKEAARLEALLQRRGWKARHTAPGALVRAWITTFCRCWSVGLGRGVSLVPFHELACTLRSTGVVRMVAICWAMLRWGSR